MELRVAAVQMTSTPDRDANLATAARLTTDALDQGATFVVLPETFDLLGLSDDSKPMSDATLVIHRANDSLLRQEAVRSRNIHATPGSCLTIREQTGR